MEQVKFTVIIPVYNKEQCVEKAINSIVNQTYTNWEMILIDDGSTDNSGVICDNFANYDSRIKVIHKKNGGVSSAKNVGLELATGEYILVCDADDYCEINLMSVIAESIEKFGNIDMVFYGFYYNGNNKPALPKGLEFNKIYDENFIKDILIPSQINIIEKNGISISPSGCDKAFRADIIKQNCLRFDEKLHTWEDNFFNILFLSKCKNIVVLNVGLYNYIMDLSIQHLSKRLYVETIETLPYKFDILKKFFGKDYDFDSVRVNNIYFELINDQMLKVLQNKETESISDAIKVLQDPQIIAWFNGTNIKHGIRNKIIKMVANNKFTETNVERYYEKYQKYLTSKKKKENFHKTLSQIKYKLQITIKK